MIPEIRKNCKYAAACVTSMGVRITPENRMAVHNSDLFYLQATSAESNVLNVISSLGKPCLVMTKFVEGSPIAAFIKAKLRARNISFEGPDVPQGGPWGYRHQFNIADSGFGMRAPRVWNDRAGEIGRTITPEDFALERIFAEIAKQHGTLVSFDLNYRATFWKGREEELSRVFKQIASVADVLIGNEEDFQLCLGIQGPEAGGKDLASKIDSFKGMIERVREEYPNAVAYATSLRQVISANEHLWGGIMWAEGEWYVEEPRPIPLMDRIGGGDGFSGGILYAILKGWEPSKWIQFGWASGVLAACSLNDYAEPADEKQLWDIYAGNARVQR